MNDAANDPGTNPNDDVVVAPGTYHERVALGKPVNIRGAAGLPLPVITWDGSGDTTFDVASTAAGSTFQHLDLRATGSSSTVLSMFAAGTGSDLSLTGTSGCASLGNGAHLGPAVTATATSAGPHGSCVGASSASVLQGLTVSAPGATGVLMDTGATLTDSSVSGDRALAIEDSTARRDTLNGVSAGATDVLNGGTTEVISDSVITSTEAGSRAVFVPGTDDGSGSPVMKLRNVTAIATGSDSHALEAGVLDPPPQFGGSGAIDARNVIARGAGTDLVVDPAVSPCPPSRLCAPGAITVDHSNFVTASAGVATPVDPHDQSGDPLFVNGVLGPGADFHLASGASPAIGAGVQDPDGGPTDRDGTPHPNPPAIGAYERAAPGGAGTTVGSGAGAGTGATADTVAPGFLSSSLTNRVFAVDRHGPAETLVAARAAKKGTSFTYSVSEPARVVFTIERPRPGRKVGTKCRKQRRSNRRRARCTRYKLFGRFAQQAAAGANRKHWSGRIGGRALSPGRYRATLVATDPAGNRSRASRLAFRVVRR